MVEVITEQQREQAKEQYQKSQEAIANLKRVAQQLISRRNLSGGISERTKRQSAMRDVSQDISQFQQRANQMKRFAEMETLEEYNSRRQSEYENAVNVARKMIEKGVPTKFLSGTVREIVKQFRDSGYRPETTQTTYADTFGQKMCIDPSKVNFNQTSYKTQIAPLWNTSNVNMTNASVSNQTSKQATKKLRIDWLA